jgi:hypothetical protein
MTDYLALKNAEVQANNPGQRGLQDFVGLVAQIPGVGGGFANEARDLQAQSQRQVFENERSRAIEPGQGGDLSRFSIPGVAADLDPEKVAAQIYPILVWRDRLVKV